MAADDKLTHQQLGANPADGAEVVTKSDTVELTYISRGIWVGGAGDVTAIMKDGTSILFASVPAGTLLPIRCRRIASTGTTATNMVSLW